jgi:trehalose 6-phosphate synthase
MSDLLIISNRAPFSFSETFLAEAEKCLKSGKAPEAPRFGEGGLVQAMSSLLKPGKWNPTWIGSSMGEKDIEVARGHYGYLFKKMAEEGYAPHEFPLIEIDPDTRMHFTYQDYDFYMRFVFFDTRHMHSYYNKFANGFLWPLMHLTRPPVFYKKARAFPRPNFEKNDFIQYTSSGVTFANTIVDEIRKSKEFWKREDDLVVWNQDYHFLRIAETTRALLREAGFSKEERNRIHVGQFIHTPFFDIHEIQGLIREDKRSRVRSQIYDPFGESIEGALQKLTWGMLFNDFIGFHTKEYCDNYLEALEEWFPVDIRVTGRHYEIGHQDRVTTVGALPIGLDVDRILAEVAEGKVLDHESVGESLCEKIHKDRKAGKTIFGGLERCDYTKGLIERCGLFQHALSRIRASGKDGRFYQVTSPSRGGSTDYQYLNAILAEEIEGINKKLGHEAIIHVGEGIPPPQNYRFMKEVEVMLVTPLEDGMNLVAFEYILSQKFKKPEKRGILVLSSSGASRVLKEWGFGEKDGVIYVDPMKAKGAGEKVVKAMEEERHISDKLIDHVEKERRVDEWAEKNIEAILNTRRVR